MAGQRSKENAPKDDGRKYHHAHVKTITPSGTNIKQAARRLVAKKSFPAEVPLGWSETDPISRSAAPVS
jgi:hypothetical protein